MSRALKQVFGEEVVPFTAINEMSMMLTETSTEIEVKTIEADLENMKLKPGERA